MSKVYLFLVFSLMFVVTGCVEVGQTTGDVEVCTGDTAECGDAHDESSDSSDNSTTNTTDTT
jgi:hypothetical protein|tara:strand:- start:1504 stop:1689 length:186 start_codon:yes stop_codon:yes gene_type:complete